ncbi:cinnamoyl-CoA reductase 1 [Aegilops tauschii subsp. strangulata]|uniref:NAD-dependent epimerase/dehydratase domain-containing protein n=6 Tax=Aegilops tauschii subsp. strangulata TaxID=200361 RepID=A0A453SK32_AEGTS|nr:cinnamoyl-CoA reductase 1 [Aegilops tauschii subsp. strangulata]
MDPAGAGKATAAAAAVCVTGAGGFIASWLVERLLAGGDYAVHGTVRDPSDPKNKHLRALDGAGERLRLFKADVLDYASVASTVAGCAGVFHVASPCPAAQPTNPEVELLAPAVAGTLNVLRACREAGVRRVVVVSSVGAVFMNPNPPEGPTMDEHCWSNEEYCRATENWYCLSKTLAEREAWAYAEKAGLDVVTVCPPLVFGPLLQPTVNTSSLFLIRYLKCDGVDAMDDRVRNMVDVRDVADALVLAYESPEAAGRYICSAHARKVSEMVYVVRSLHPSLNCANKFVQLVGDEKVFSTEKLQRLGWKFRTLEETLKDSVESYMSAGILS